jgi:hypothetical protein
MLHIDVPITHHHYRLDVDCHRAGPARNPQLVSFFFDNIQRTLQSPHEGRPHLQRLRSDVLY